MIRYLAWIGDRFEELIASIAVVVVIAAVSWGVITRYVTAQPATWAGEVATLGFAWVVFFGAAACIKYELHPEIDLLVGLTACSAEKSNGGRCKPIDYDVLGWIDRVPTMAAAALHHGRSRAFRKGSSLEKALRAAFS